MSKIKKALERSLELTESLSLVELQKYPNAATLIPLLREILEQEEECSHVWNENGTCVGCGISKVDCKIKEDGPWIPVMYDNQVTVQSEDPTHDVTMKITGDFSSIQQFYEYARMISRRLNSYNEERS